MARIGWMGVVAAMVITLVASVAPVAADGQTGVPQMLAQGSYHSCAIGTSGQLKCWGLNDKGQLGLGDTATRGDGPGEMGTNLPAIDLGTGRTATTVVAGEYHTCAVLDSGQVKCWGSNNNGQLGLGNTANRGDGPGEMGDNLPAVDLGTGRTATALTAGIGFTCALLDNGQVKCWGLNGNGRLGLGNTANRGDGPGEMGDNLPAVDLGTGRTATALSARANHTCALLDDGTIKCWGFNAHGELGLGDPADRGDGASEMGDNLPAVDLGTGRTATEVSVGYGHTCAILDNGALKCWGFNGDGRLGLGDTNLRGDGAGEMGDNLPVIDLGTGRTASAVAAGDGHICAILDNGVLKCWGVNAAGQLGLGDTATRGDGPGEMGDNLPVIDLGTGRTASAVAAGGSTCVRLDNGRVRCWGANGNAQLGLGDVAPRGDGAGEMGDDLPFVDLAIDPSLTVTADVDATTHYSGDQLTYTLTLDNPGDVDLTGVGLTGTTGLTCDPLADTLAIGAEAAVDCSRTLTLSDVGTVSASFGATSDQATAAAADAPDVQVYKNKAPDGEIKRAGLPYVGAEIINDDATDQTVRVGRARGGSVTFFARFTNVGDTASRYLVTSGASDHGLSVRYFQGQSSTEITTAIEAGTYKTAKLSPGGTAVIRIEIKVKATARHLVDHDITLQAHSPGSAPQLDTVRARVHVN